MRWASSLSEFLSLFVVAVVFFVTVAVAFFEVAVAAADVIILDVIGGGVFAVPTDAVGMQPCYCHCCCHYCCCCCCC